MPSGVFITFEGIDGSGKSTQLRLLKDWLEESGRLVIATRQPGGTRVGDRIRSLLLDSRAEEITPLAELGLMFSDRAQSIRQVILPALSNGDIVLCDRFTDSTEAYQGGGRELGSGIVLDLHASLCGGLNPHLTFLLMPDFDQSLNRARRRNERVKRSTGADENRFEVESGAFYHRVLDKYKEIAAREPSRVVVIDGAGTIDEVHQRIRGIAEKQLEAAFALQGSQPS